MSSRYGPKLSIIIPTLNEGRCIGATLAAVSGLSISAEMIVVDGGSEDSTRELARAFGANVIASQRGRGMQMHAGACAAQGEVFWFLHADTIVPTNGAYLIAEALSDPRIVAGNFNLRFDGPAMAARFMTWLYLHLRKLGLCYGDSAIFVRREAYEQIGGFKSLPIFEDLDLLRGLRKLGTFAHLPATVVTSSRRFDGYRFMFTFVRWIVMQCLYWLGVDARRLGRLYAPVRNSGTEVKRGIRANNSSLTEMYNDRKA